MEKNHKAGEKLEAGRFTVKIAGEKLKAGRPVYVGKDGKVYIARPTQVVIPPKKRKMNRNDKLAVFLITSILALGAAAILALKIYSELY